MELKNESRNSNVTLIDLLQVFVFVSVFIFRKTPIPKAIEPTFGSHKCIASPIAFVGAKNQGWQGNTSMQNSGQEPNDHFPRVENMVEIGSGAKRDIGDIHLSSYACFLSYKMLFLQKKLLPWEYAVFQNHGYMGLYNGLGAKEIQARKGLKKAQNILDHI